MKVVLAGAFGQARAATSCARSCATGTTCSRWTWSCASSTASRGSYEKKQVDVTKPEQLAGLCEGADAVITTVGLTRTSAEVTNYDIDYRGNLNLLNEAKRAGVKKFAYVSVLKADRAPKVPMLHAKYLLEEALKASGIDYVISAPPGIFYDIAKVFKPMIEKGEVTLLGRSPSART